MFRVRWKHKTEIFKSREAAMTWAERHATDEEGCGAKVSEFAGHAGSGGGDWHVLKTFGNQTTAKKPPRLWEQVLLLLHLASKADPSGKGVLTVPVALRALTTLRCGSAPNLNTFYTAVQSLIRRKYAERIRGLNHTVFCLNTKATSSNVGLQAELDRLQDHPAGCAQKDIEKTLAMLSEHYQSSAKETPAGF